MQKLKGTALDFLYMITTLVLIFSSLIVVISFIKFLDGNEKAKLTLIVFSFITIIMVIFTKRIKKSKASISIDEIDNFILKYAINHSGLITAVDLASETSYSLKEASIHLERNYREGYCDKKLTSDSLIDVYYFKGAVSKKEKQDYIEIK